jgi:hypothetical protein
LCFRLQGGAVKVDYEGQMLQFEIDEALHTRGEGRNSYRIVSENPEDLVVDGIVMIKCVSRYC